MPEKQDENPENNKDFNKQEILNASSLREAIDKSLENSSLTPDEADWLLARLTDDTWKIKNDALSEWGKLDLSVRENFEERLWLDWDWILDSETVQRLKDRSLLMTEVLKNSAEINPDAAFKLLPDFLKNNPDILKILGKKSPQSLIEYFNLFKSMTLDEYLLLTDSLDSVDFTKKEFDKISKAFIQNEIQKAIEINDQEKLTEILLLLLQQDPEAINYHIKQAKVRNVAWEFHDGREDVQQSVDMDEIIKLASSSLAILLQWRVDLFNDPFKLAWVLIILLDAKVKWNMLWSSLVNKDWKKSWILQKVTKDIVQSPLKDEVIRELIMAEPDFELFSNNWYHIQVLMMSVLSGNNRITRDLINEKTSLQPLDQKIIDRIINEGETITYKELMDRLSRTRKYWKKMTKEISKTINTLNWKFSSPWNKLLNEQEKI